MPEAKLLPSHQTREHTSEIELHIRAGSWEDLLAEAGRALAEVEMAGADLRPGGPVRSIRIESADRDALLVDWLNELISLIDIERWIGLDFEIIRATDTELQIQASGATVERTSNRVKAATLHGVRVREVPGGLEANVILDV